MRIKSNRNYRSSRRNTKTYTTLGVLWSIWILITYRCVYFNLFTYGHSSTCRMGRSGRRFASIGTDTIVFWSLNRSLPSFPQITSLFAVFIGTCIFALVKVCCYKILQPKQSAKLKFLLHREIKEQ